MVKNPIGIIVDVDDLVLDVTGFTRGEMVGTRSTEFMHPDDHELALSSWIRMLGKPGEPQQIHARHRTANGRWLWVEITNTLDPSDATVIRTEMVLIDRPPVDRTSVSSALLRHLADALPMGLVQIDTDRRVVFCNGKLADLTGRPHADGLADILGEMTPADDETLGRALDTVLGGDDTEIELSVSHPVRGTRRCDVILSALAGRSGFGTTGALLCVTDITDDAQQRDAILHRAAHDALTGCLNRAAILERLTASVTACTGEAGVAVLFFDLDRFKPINDTHGHAAGDHLLVTVAQRLRRNTRDAHVGRLGGDEFLVVARDIPSAGQADVLGKRLIRAIRRPLNLGGTAVRPGASVGVAWTADPATDPADLVAAADTAMYEAKKRRHPRTGAAR
jgi:diguanylate cyclase (GGDEF)-like protein/PAS domain S-box-containing protein